MTDPIVNADGKGEEEKEKAQAQGSDNASEKSGHMVPKSRLDQEISKRKEGEEALKEIAQSYLDEVPEEMKDLVPDLPPLQKIHWLRNALAKGLFNGNRVESGPDSKRPGAKQAVDLSGLSPAALRRMGYKN